MSLHRNLSLCSRVGCYSKFVSPSNPFFSSKPGTLVMVTEEEISRTANVIMNRAPVNSFNLELLQDLTAAIKDLENKKFRGITISSSLPTVFSAGLDITEMYKPNEERFKNFWKSLQTFWKTLFLTPMVTMAALNGHAPAGGCMMALSCDYRVMVNGRTTIGLNETKLGLATPLWFQSLLVQSIGHRQAEKALNVGTLFSPEEALRLGMVDELATDSEDLKARIQKQMESWLKIPSAARQTTKMALRKPFVDALSKYEDQEVAQVLQFTNMESTQKALESYFESMKAKK